MVSLNKLVKTKPHKQGTLNRVRMLEHHFQHRTRIFVLTIMKPTQTPNKINSENIVCSTLTSTIMWKMNMIMTMTYDYDRMIRTWHYDKNHDSISDNDPIYLMIVQLWMIKLYKPKMGWIYKHMVILGSPEFPTT